MSHSHLPRQVRVAGRFASAGGSREPPRSPLSGRLLRAGTDLVAGGPTAEKTRQTPQSRALVPGAHCLPDPHVVGAGRRPPAVPQRLSATRGRQLSPEGRAARRRRAGRGARPPARGGRLARAHAPQPRGAGGGEGGCAWGARAAAAAASACCSARAACSRRSAPARRLPSGHGRRGVRGVESASPGPASRTLTVPVSGGGGGGDPAGTLRDGSSGLGQPFGDSEVLCGSRP